MITDRCPPVPPVPPPPPRLLLRPSAASDASAASAVAAAAGAAAGNVARCSWRRACTGIVAVVSVCERGREPGEARALLPFGTTHATPCEAV